MATRANSALEESDRLAFLADPLAWLAQVRRIRGPVFRLNADGAVFSRLMGPCAVFAAFGEPAVRHVLTDGDAFKMPESAAGALNLPPRIARLSRSLHSMGEPEHCHHKHALGALLGTVAADSELIDQVVEPMAVKWAQSRPQPLLARMRELTQAIAQRVLLGPDADGSIVANIHGFFVARQEAASTPGHTNSGSRASLLAKGRRLDRLLRHNLVAGSGGSTFGRLCVPVEAEGFGLSADEAVGHLNIAIASAIEPVAVALTWTLLLLSQRADLRSELRHDEAAINRLVLESLRVLPPNAFMVRVTSRDVELGGVLLPSASEVILCPWLTHRDSEIFDAPEVLMPDRWKQARPSPFEYFPFGAGHHGCVGRSLGMDLLRGALNSLVRRFDVVLAGDQAIDWRVDILMMPRTEIQVRFAPAGAGGSTGGRWAGPVSELVNVGV